MPTCRSQGTQPTHINTRNRTNTLIPPTTVQLILGYRGQQATWLDIPLSVICQNTVRHHKSLVFAATYITGVQGHISTRRNGPPPPSDHVAIAAGQCWYWVPLGGRDPLGFSAISSSAGVGRGSQAVSHESSGRTAFRDNLRRRDDACVFTLHRSNGAVAMHIIPHHVGDEHLAHIFESRASLEDVDLPNLRHPDNPSLLSINDPRNGLMVTPLIHYAYDCGELGILATPNLVLTNEDLHPPVVHNRVVPHMAPPTAFRLTLQWFAPLLEDDLNETCRNNVAASFKKKPSRGDPKPPHPALLNYAYACRLVHNFCKLSTVFKERKRMPRAPLPPHWTTSSSNKPSATTVFVERTAAARRELLVKRGRTDIDEATCGEPMEDVDLGEESLSDDESLLSPEDDDIDYILTEHPDGPGRCGEGGRITAEDFMYLLHAGNPGFQKWRQGCEDQKQTAEQVQRAAAMDRVQDWREGAYL